MTNYTELSAIYDNRKSFYGKARIRKDRDGLTLISYETEVAKIVDKNNGYSIAPYAVIYGTYSTTTLRHIKEFLKQNGFKAESKAQIEKDYLNWGGESLFFFLCRSLYIIRSRAENNPYIIPTREQARQGIIYSRKTERILYRII